MSMPYVAYLLFGVGLLLAPPAPQPDAPVAGQHVIAKYRGEVREYKPGNLLEVDIGDKKVKSYDLSTNKKVFDIGPEMEKKRSVDIVEFRDEAGREVVRVRVRP